MLDALPETLRWRNDQLQIIDQRLLPQQFEYLTLETLQQAWLAINTLAVRGAPAIGVAAAYALAQSMQNVPSDQYSKTLTSNGDYLKSARPTAVNLAWAVDRLIRAYRSSQDPTTLLKTAMQIHAEDLAISRNIGLVGAQLIQANAGVLTHCNAGSLATSRLGTATAPMYTQHLAGVPFRVFADETRPLYQGARLTAWELERAGLDVTLICDNMAASLMAKG